MSVKNAFLLSTKDNQRKLRVSSIYHCVFAVIFAFINPLTKIWFSISVSCFIFRAVYLYIIYVLSKLMKKWYIIPNLPTQKN